MQQRTLFRVMIVIVLLSPLVCAALWAQAKTSADAATPASGAPPAVPATALQQTTSPAPISAANIATEAQAANLRLRRIKLDLDTAVKLSDVEQQLAILTRSLQRIRPALEPGEILEEEEWFNYRQQLMRFSLRLKELQTELVPRSQVLEERREEIKSLELLWKVTEQSLSAQEAPSSSRDLVRSMQQLIGETAAVIRTYRPVLLTVQNRISEQLIAADTLLARTNDAIDKIRKQFFAIDTEPLWRAFQFAPGSSVADSIRRSYLRRVLPLLDYVKDNKRRFLAHLLISAFLVWLLAVVSRDSRKWLKSTGETRELAHVLYHPLAAALVVSLLLSFSIYPNPPLILYRLPLLLMMFPLVRVVSGALSRDQRTAFYFLTGLYVLWRMDGVFSLAGLVFRLFVLGLTCLAIIGALLGARADYVASRAGIGPWRTARLHLLRIAVLILLGSVIANVVGNVTLAVLLSSACISSAYAAAALFAGVLVLEGFLMPLFESPLAQRSVAIREQSGKFRRRSSLLIRFGALIAWVGSTLSVFEVSEPVRTWLSSVLARQWPLGQISFSIGGILLFAVTIYASVWLARFAAFVAEKDILSKMKLPQGVAATASTLVRDSIIAFGFIVALAGAGVQWGQIALVAGAIGVGIGFGLQQLVASFVAGLILMIERPIRVGDTIEIEKIEGVVSRIGLRSSTIQVVDGSELICPNSRLISEDLINWTLSNQLRRVEVQVGVPHGVNPDDVLAILKKVAGEHPLVLQKPEPTPLFKGFGESSLMFILRFFTSQDIWVQVSSEVVTRINNALREKGIEIALPQRNIRITGESSPDGI